MRRKNLIIDYLKYIIAATQWMTESAAKFDLRGLLEDLAAASSGLEIVFDRPSQVICYSLIKDDESCVGVSRKFGST